MSDTTFVEKVGLHILLVTMSSHVLRGENALLITDVEEALSYFRNQRPGTLNVLLHEEPLYIAGHMLGLSEESIDDLPVETSERYNAFYKQITARTRGRRRDYLKKIWSALIELALRENVSTGLYELQLEELPIPSSAGPDRPTRRTALRR